LLLRKDGGERVSGCGRGAWHLNGFQIQDIVQIALGEEKPVCLPQVLIRGVHVGGMEEIKKLNDGGKLGEMLKGFPACESVGACGCCGDPRFVPCTIYY